MDTGPRPILAASAPRVTRFPLAASSRPAPSPVDPRRKRRPKTPPENTARKHQPENTSPKRQRGRTASEDRPPVGARWGWTMAVAEHVAPAEAVAGASG